MSEKKQRILWAVFDVHGDLYCKSIAYLRKDAIEAFIDDVGATWEDCKREGFTVKKITLGWKKVGGK